MRVVALLPVLFVGVFIVVSGVIGDLYYLTYQLSWKLILVFFCWSVLHIWLFSVFGINNRRKFFTYNEFGSFSLACISVLSLFISFHFVLNNVETLDLFSLAAFSERYRNGFYSGSFAFTFLSLFVVPTLLSHQIVYTKSLSILLWLLILLSVANFMIFGFRILVLYYVIAFIMRFNLDVHENRKSYLTLIILLIVFLLLPMFKVLLIPNDGIDKAAVYFDFLLQPFFRAKTYALLQDDFLSFNSYHCLFPFLGRFCELSPEEIKYSILLRNNILEIYFITVNKFSGVALSGVAFLLNQFGFLAIIFLAMFSTVYLFFVRLLFCRNPLPQLIAVQSIIVLIGFVFEDIMFLRRLDIIIFFCIFISLLTSFKLIRMSTKLLKV